MKNKQEKKKSERKMRKAFMLTLAVAIAFIGVLPAVMAHCPLCTGATIVGVGITRSFGLDDSIVGVFVGGMIISTALWFNNVLKKRNIGTKGRPGKIGPKIKSEPPYSHVYSFNIKPTQKFNESKRSLIPRHIRKGSPVLKHQRRKR